MKQKRKFAYVFVFGIVAEHNDLYGNLQHF